MLDEFTLGNGIVEICFWKAVEFGWHRFHKHAERLHAAQHELKLLSFVGADEICWHNLMASENALKGPGVTRARQPPLLSARPRESGDPGAAKRKNWIPACAGMSGRGLLNRPETAGRRPDCAAARRRDRRARGGRRGAHSRCRQTPVPSWRSARR